MIKIGIIVNASKDVELEITSSIVKWIESNNALVMLTKDVSIRLEKHKYGYSLERIYKDSDFIVVLGGDGTILGVAREVIKYETPLLGVNLGHLGFLAEVEVKDLFKALEIAINKDIRIEKRMMLDAAISGEKANGGDLYALNDVVISRGILSRIITMKIFINDNYFTTLNGDGLIIATPTGSTAYSLSAGGPIINPNLSLITLTPICTHSLSNRSIVISQSETIKVDLTENHGDAYLTIDGQEGYKIEDGQNIVIKKAPFTTNLIKLLDRSFYNVLRTKLAERL